MRVEQKPEEKKLEKFIPPQPVGKVVTLVVLVVATTALFWLAWHNALTTGLTFDLGPKNIITVVSTLLALCLMFCILALTEVLVTKRLVLLGTVLLSSATVFIFFKPSIWTFIGYLLMSLGFLYWSRTIRVDLKSRTKFIPQKTISMGLRGVVFFVLLAASFTYYSFLVTREDSTSSLTNSIAATGVSAVDSILKGYYQENYSPEMTLDEFIKNLNPMASEEFAVETGRGEIDEIIKEGLSAAEEDLISRGRDEFLETFGIQASGHDTMRSVIKKIVVKNLNKVIEPYLKYIPWLLALSLFFVMSIFSFVYRELIKSLTYLLFHILKWIKFINIKKIHVEAEKISL